jgi:hypothetical protein
MKNLIAFFLIFTPIFVLAQHENESIKLSEKNGFRDIKLGSNVNNYPYIIKSKSSDDFYWYKNGRTLYFGGYDVNYFVDNKLANYEKIGITKIQKVFVATRNDIIYKIVIITDYSKSLLENLKIMYGEGTGFWDTWSGDDIFLSLTSGDGVTNDYCTLVYTKSSIDDIVKKEADLRYQKFKNEQNEKIKKDF